MIFYEIERNCIHFVESPIKFSKECRKSPYIFLKVCLQNYLIKAGKLRKIFNKIIILSFFTICS